MALGAAPWVLAACGGGGGDGSASAPGALAAAPITAAAPAPPPASLPTARIEAYEHISAREASTDTVPFAGPTETATEIRLAALPAAPAGADPKAAGSGKAAHGPRQIGRGRAIGATADAPATAARLAWRTRGDSRLIAALRFRSDGAASVRLGLHIQRLPPGSILRVAAPDGRDSATSTAEQLQATLDRLASHARVGERVPDARTVWLPPVGGEAAVLEILLPPGADPSQVTLAVPYLSHQWANLGKGEDSALKVGEASSCNIDASCEAGYLDESRAVARMEYVKGTDSYLCTGTLMADVAGSGTPWFLSARHCIADQSAAATLVTYWFYRSATCGSSAVHPQAQRLTGGATLLYEAAATDTAFLRLERSPPAGTRHAGSLLTAPAGGTPVIGLHHPRGDLARLSEGSVTGLAGCSTSSADGNVTCGQAGIHYAALRWRRGTTEPGSSGSALFVPVDGKAYVTAQLFAGRASCEAPTEPDFYGRLDMAYRDGLWRYLGDVPGAR